MSTDTDMYTINQTTVSGEDVRITVNVEPECQKRLQMLREFYELEHEIQASIRRQAALAEALWPGGTSATP